MTEETPLKGQKLAETKVLQATVAQKTETASAEAQIVESAPAESPSIKTEASAPKEEKKTKTKKTKAAAKTKGKDKFYIPVKVGQEMKGRIKTITDFGAFVDLNLSVDGLVHISQMSRRRIENVKDVVSPGDEVTVWVKNVNRERGRVGLTMLKPLKYKYKDIHEGDILDGEVKRVESYGVFVDVGLEREGLVHVSELSHEYIKSPADAVSVGDEVKVQVLKIDVRKKQVNLSIKTLLPPPEVEEPEEAEEIVANQDAEEEFEEEEPMTTLMAAAFGQLDNFNKPTRRKKASKKRKRNRNKAMDELVSKTLQVGQQK